MSGGLQHPSELRSDNRAQPPNGHHCAHSHSADRRGIAAGSDSVEKGLRANYGAAERENNNDDQHQQMWRFAQRQDRQGYRYKGHQYGDVPESALQELAEKQGRETGTHIEGNLGTGRFGLAESGAYQQRRQPAQEQIEDE